MRARQFGEEARSGGCFLGSEHGRLGWEHGFTMGVRTCVLMRVWFYDQSARLQRCPHCGQVSGCDQSAVGCAESVDFCDESAALRWEDGAHGFIKTEA